MNNYKKELVDYTYAFGRNLSEAYVMKKWHPTIINADLIPTDGPIILCGNHLHKHDQFPVMCATKRTIHWMAKDEYFTDIKSAPVMHMMGCIRVNRGEGKIDNSKEIAIDYLNKGSAVGIFPEGTRNVYQIALKKLSCIRNEMESIINCGFIDKIAQEKLEKLNQQYKLCLRELEQAKQIVEKKGNKVIENELLLPFKFGAISMAAHTGAKIVPFAVTGDYTEDNDNLMVRFGEAYNLSSSDYENESNVLREKVKQLLIENYDQTGYR